MTTRGSWETNPARRPKARPPGEGLPGFQGDARVRDGRVWSVRGSVPGCWAPLGPALPSRLVVLGCTLTEQRGPRRCAAKSRLSRLDLCLFLCPPYGLDTRFQSLLSISPKPRLPPRQKAQKNTSPFVPFVEGSLLRCLPIDPLKTSLNNFIFPSILLMVGRTQFTGS